jgi:hypothetical protein
MLEDENKLLAFKLVSDLVQYVSCIYVRSSSIYKLRSLLIDYLVSIVFHKIIV